MKVVLQNRLASDILTVTQGGICAIIHTQCCAYIKDMSTNVTHFTKHMNMLIQAWILLKPHLLYLRRHLPMVENYLNCNNPDCSVFAPCICNCVAGYISCHMKSFKLQMVVQTP